MPYYNIAIVPGRAYIVVFPALKCVGVNNVSRVGICCFLYYKELLICNIVV